MSYKVEVESDDGNGYRSMMVITDDSGKREHWDGGEPEDNSFGRDWDWVEVELMKAYQQGLKDAMI